MKCEYLDAKNCYKSKNYYKSIQNNTTKNVSFLMNYIFNIKKNVYISVFEINFGTN